MERFEIEAGAARLVGTATGAGPPIVLLHPGVADRHCWSVVQSALTSRFRTVAYDRRGFGETTYTPEQFSDVADLLAVIRHLGLEEVVLVGNSMGGALAIDFALEHRQLARGLVLIGAAVSGAPPLDVDSFAEARIDAAIEFAEGVGDLAEVNRLEAWLWLDGGDQPEGRVAGPARTRFLEMNRVALEAEDPGERHSATPAFDRLGDLDVPALLVVGEYDIAYQRELTKVLAASMSGARSMTLPGVAHVPQLEEPVVVAELIGDFVAGLDP